MTEAEDRRGGEEVYIEEGRAPSHRVICATAKPLGK